jgi:Lar family restriction alleviation protein
MPADQTTPAQGGELKACPFCGKQPEPCPQRDNAGSFVIWCEHCGADGPNGTEAEALAAWNHRAEEGGAKGVRTDLTALAGANRPRDADSAVSDYGWITHKPGDPMPVGGGTVVDIRLEDGTQGIGYSETAAGNWNWSRSASEGHGVAAYRLAHPAPSVQQQSNKE